MDFAYSDDQQAVLELARQILEDHCTQKQLQTVEKGDAPRFDRELWKKLAEAGLLGAGVPEEHGGGGLGFLEIAGIAEQIGRTAAPVPFVESAVMAGLALAEFGSAAQQAAWLPKLVAGEAVLTAALVEPYREADDPGTTATREGDGDGWVLTGEKLCVPAGQIASLVLVPARSDDGVGVFLVEPGARGVTRTDLVTTSRQPECVLALDGVRVGSDALLGDVAHGRAIVRWIEQRTTAALANVAVGCCEEALRLTAEYTKTRKQFDQPIATFQAVGQRAADAFIDTEAVRLTALQAAWRIHEGLEAGPAVAVAKFWAAEGGSRIVRAAQHLHGGVGVDREYPLHRFYLYQRQIELTLGGATQQLRRLGRQIAAGEA